MSFLWPESGNRVGVQFTDRYDAAMYQFSLHRVSDTHVELRFSLFWRIFFLAVTALFLGVAFQGGEVIWPAVVIALITLVSALYQESWVFSLDQGQIISSIGVFPFLKRSSWDISMVEAIGITAAQHQVNSELSRQSWHAGQERMGNFFSKKTARLELRLSDGRRVLIYTEQSRKVDRIHTIAASLVTFLQLPLFEEEH